jgi:ABC-type branched-subunit amino acid transport system ATPase component
MSIRHETPASPAVVEDHEAGSSDFFAVDGLGVSFGGLVALSDVSFTLGPTDTVAIIGPNGAGKTTTLNAIGGLVRSTGRVELAGRDLSGAKPVAVAQAGIGRSFQDPVLIDEYSVFENVLCGAFLRLGYSTFDQVFRRRRVRDHEKRMGHRAMELLEVMGIAGLARETAGQLPYGVRKMVDIARALESGPRLLLLDEPSSGIDGHERAALQKALISLREAGEVAVLMVEHHMDLVRATATKVVALQAGTLLAAGTATEVLDSESVRTALVGGSAAPAPDPAGHRAADSEGR